jgi:histidinol-phosphate aminotransferase
MTLDLAGLIPDYIKHFHSYVPSKPDEELKKLYGCPVLHRLNNNENPLGPPPAARDIIRRFPPARSAIYPSGDSHGLRVALAEHFGKHPDRFLVGNGSCEVITSVIKAFCEPGDNIVTADKTFAVYEWVAEFSGIDRHLVALKDYVFDDEGLLSRIDGRTKVIFICNPNNPTGTCWPREQLIRFLDRVDGRCVVVLDEAYIEYVERDDVPNGLALIDQYSNLVVFRTFSKMYGLAGLRVGYLAGSRQVVDLIRRAYVVYSVNTVAQAAARAAIEHGEEHIQATRALIRSGKAFLQPALRSLGLPFLCHEGSYVMIKVPVSDTLLYRRLMKRGLMIRTMSGFRFPNWIRVSVVSQGVLEQFMDGLAEELKPAQ